jgi:hypothetical protein
MESSHLTWLQLSNGERCIGELQTGVVQGVLILRQTAVNTLQKTSYCTTQVMNCIATTLIRRWILADMFHISSDFGEAFCSAKHTYLYRYGRSRHFCYQSHHLQSGHTLSSFSVPSILSILFSDFSLARCISSSIHIIYFRLGSILMSCFEFAEAFRPIRLCKERRHSTEPIDGKPTPQPSAKLRACVRGPRYAACIMRAHTTRVGGWGRGAGSGIIHR